MFYLVDKISCQLADLVILDTNAQINYFVQTFHLNRYKFRRILIGSDEDVFKPTKKKVQKKITIGYHGAYLPLHGVQYIVEAANLLRLKSYQFILVGDGIERNKWEQRVRELKIKNIQFVDSLPYGDIAEFINSCDISLGGHFGTNKKAEIVIANKAYEAIACRTAVILGESTANREIFTDEVDCLMVERGNAAILAATIDRLAKNNILRERIARNGRNLYLQIGTSKILGKQLARQTQNL